MKQVLIMKPTASIVMKFFEHQVFARWFRSTSHPNQEHQLCNNANAAIGRDFWNLIRSGLEAIDWARRAIKTECSGRSICYLASGALVLIRGILAFRIIYPVEQGISTFQPVEEAAIGVEQLLNDYPR